MFQKNQVVMLQRAIESLYDGICTVTEYRSQTDPESGITCQEEVTVLENQPCKLSYELNYPVVQGEFAGKAAQRVKLFVSPDVDIKNGSRVTVSQNGKVTEYAFSGETAAYPTHREIRLSPFKNRA